MWNVSLSYCIWFYEIRPLNMSFATEIIKALLWCRCDAMFWKRSKTCLKWWGLRMRLGILFPTMVGSLLSLENWPSYGGKTKKCVFSAFFFGTEKLWRFIEGATCVLPIINHDLIWKPQHFSFQRARTRLGRSKTQRDTSVLVNPSSARSARPGGRLVQLTWLASFMRIELE